MMGDICPSSLRRALERARPSPGVMEELPQVAEVPRGVQKVPPGGAATAKRGGGVVPQGAAFARRG